MKKILLLTLGAIMAFGVVRSQDPLQNVTMEAFYTDDGTVTGYPVGFTTYRIYLELEDATDFLSAVYGEYDSPLDITTTTTIWNNSLAGTHGQDANSGFFPIDPSLEYDSFVTIGQASSADAGDTQSITTPAGIIDASMDAATTGATAPSLYTDQGTWFTTNGQPNGFGTGPNNRVLVAQITTDGTVTWNMNVQIFNDGDGLNGEFRYLYNGTDPVVPGVEGTYDGYCKGLSSSAIGDPSCDPVGGCLDSTACNFNPDADFDDASCIYAPCSNGGPALATELTATLFGTCNNYADDLSLADFIAPEANCATTNDLWYYFVAPTGGITVTVDPAGASDIVVELLSDASSSYASVDCEDAVGAGGTEILNVGGLVAGATYYVSVSGSAPGAFDICVQYHKETYCALPATTYSMCDSYKARWVGGVEYMFHFTSTSTQETFSEPGYYYDKIQFFKVAGLVWNHSYDVLIDVTHENADGAGTIESILVPGTSGCTISMSAPALTTVKDAYTCSTKTLWMGDYIWSTPWVCGAVDWEWRFVRTDATELPIYAFSGTGVNKVRLKNVAGLEEGGSYNVSVRSIYANGTKSNFYNAKEICIYGPIAGAIADTDVAEASKEKIAAAEAFEMGAAIYPNPNNGEYIYLNVTDVVDAEKVLVDVYDMVGNVVYSEQIAATGSNLNTIVSFNQRLASGVYMVKIMVNDRVQTERLVVEK